MHNSIISNKEPFTTIPSEVTVETVPQLFLTTLGAYDQDHLSPNHSNFSVTDFSSLKKININSSFSKKPTHYRYISDYHQRGIDDAFHFLLIVSKETGLLFLLACNFLYQQYELRKPEKEVPTTQTLRDHADKLAHMLNFFYRNKDDFDYLNFKFPVEQQRPAYKYWQYLRKEISNGTLSKSNACLFQYTSICFFRYAHDIGLIDPKAQLWREESINIQFDNETKGKVNKLISRPVHAIKNTRNKSAALNYINDGEELRPLNDDEQKIFITALKNVNPPSWIKYLSTSCYLSGARLGSIGTMRKKHLEDLKDQMSAGVEKPFVFAGTASTLIQTKDDKPIRLYFPHLAIHYLDRYMSSNTRKSDLKKAEKKGLVFDDKSNQHIFINERGNHVYWSKFNFSLLKDWVPPPTRPGNRASHYFSETLKPAMHLLGYKGNFRLHYLRATFAMNYIRNNYRPDMSATQINNLLEILKDLLGHNDIKVTQSYLNNYNTNFNDSPITLVNEEFAKSLLGEL